MSAIASLLSAPQVVAPAPVPALAAAADWSGTETALGLPHADLRSDSRSILFRSTRPSTVRMHFGFTEGPAGPSPEPMAEAWLHASPESTPLSVTAMLESMVRQLLARDRLSAARRLLQTVPSGGEPEGPSLRRLRMLLSEPHLQRRSAARPGGTADLTWLTRNAAAYRGQWVAVANGVLLDSDVSLDVLLKRIRSVATGVAPLLHRL
jgi:hypothetical protein